jgi:O-methyltransferase involved in polyketide biosynthesis
VPETLQWVEVDLPEITDYKEEVLKNEKPRCSLLRVRLDLADRAARRALFAELGSQGKTTLIITEGLLIYLTPDKVGELADDLAEPPGFRRWIVDMVSPGLRNIMTRNFGALLDAGGVPFQFSPAEGPEFFTKHGWTPKIVRSMLKTAAEKKRVPIWLRILSRFGDPKPPFDDRKPWGGICLLERPDRV